MGDTEKMSLCVRAYMCVCVSVCVCLCVCVCERERESEMQEVTKDRSSPPF
jgi:hypothetical protein